MPHDVATDRPASRRDNVVIAVLALGIAAAIGVRLHVLDDDFPNPDIAGIAYNAEILLAGGLPYVDTLEIKPPGAFFLAAGSFAVLGRSLLLLQLVHALWLGLGGLGVWLAARAVVRDARAAAIATAVAIVAMAMFSYNYSSWMTPLYALAVGAALQGMREGRMRWHVLAGAMSLFAFATIQRAVVLALLLPALWAWARREDWPHADRRAVLGWIAGAALALGLLALPWIARGETSTLLSALLPWSTGREYAEASSASLLATFGGAFVQLVRVFWLAVLLAGLAVVAAATEQPRSLRAFVPGALWLLASIAGAAIGGQRFYLHYLVQYAPALGLLAGHPALVRVFAGRRVRDRVLTIACLSAVVAQLVEIGLGHGHRYEAMARRLTTGLTAAQAAGAHIRQRTPSSATVLAWGWTAWPVYYWAERRSPSRIYKELGAVTTYNTNTELAVGPGPRFRPGPAADELIAAFDRDPPAYFVYSPSLITTFGARTDPLEDFTALRDRVRADYVPDAVFGDLRLFRRRGQAASDPP